jgi:hypothetical protein
MQRRKYLAAIGSLAAGGAAITGSGAFSSVSADRDMTVNVADDANAFLSFELTGQANSDYAQITGSSDNTLEIALDGSITDSDGNPEGSGVNNDAYTLIRDIFKITNQGTSTVYVGVDGSDLPNKSADPEDTENPDKAIDFFSDDADNGAGLGVGEGYYSGSGLGLSTKGVELTPGETLNRIGLHVYTPIPDSELPIGDVTFIARTQDEIDFRS